MRANGNAPTRGVMPLAVIVERQDASSGMQAFADLLLVLYLVPLAALVWPLVFNLLAHGAGRRRRARGA